MKRREAWKKASRAPKKSILPCTWELIIPKGPCAGRTRRGSMKYWPFSTGFYTRPVTIATARPRCSRSSSPRVLFLQRSTGESMKEAVIVAAVRTPMGRHGGILKDIRTDDLAAYIINKLVERTAINKEEIEDVYLGCTNQAGEDSRNVARNASLLAGLPYTVPGATVNRLCGSGLEAINDAARAVQTDHGDLFVAGGVESMTRGPWVMAKPANAFQRGDITMYDSSLGWRFPNKRMAELYSLINNGEIGRASC